MAVGKRMQGALKILSLKNKKAGTTINPVEKGRRWAPVVEPLSSDLCRGKYKGGPSMVGGSRGSLDYNETHTSPTDARF